jgi:hypothetical protein
MFFTHIFDIIFKLISIIISIFGILILIEFYNDALAAFIISFVFSILLYGLIFRTIASLLYARFYLKMELNYLQAKKLNIALSPLFSLGNKWLPLLEIKEIEADYKYENALKLIENWKQEQKSEQQKIKQNFNDASIKTKILTIIMYGLVLYVFTAVFMHWYPMNLLNDFYMDLFNTNEYYPMLNGMITALPIILIFKMIDKNIS